jgi:hypothetical protein
MAGSTRIAQINLSIHFGTKLPVRTTVIDNDSITTATFLDASMLTQWVPPCGLPQDDDDYPGSVLGKDGLL